MDKYKCTKKPHICEHCGKVIPAGSKVYSWVDTQKDTMERKYSHMTCNEDSKKCL